MIKKFNRRDENWTVLIMRDYIQKYFSPHEKYKCDDLTLNLIFTFVHYE